MKRNIIGYLLLLIAAVSLNSCSDDNEDTPEQKKQYSSLVSEFLETYNFKSTETLNEDLKVDLYGNVIQIVGVQSYEAIDYNANVMGTGPKVKVTVGKTYNQENNRHNFNRLLEKYGDTHCESQVFDGTQYPYRPHPYGITSISFTLEDKYTSEPPLITYNPKDPRMPPYNKNYPLNSDCSSLFKIRYRTYYDYIKNGYSWEGLGTTSPWKEMELTEFNRRGGDNLIDMSCIYLIVKERPSYYYLQPWHLGMIMIFDNGKTNIRNSDLKILLDIRPL